VVKYRKKDSVISKEHSIKKAILYLPKNLLTILSRKNHDILMCRIKKRCLIINFRLRVFVSYLPNTRYYPSLKMKLTINSKLTMELMR